MQLPLILPSLLLIVPPASPIIVKVYVGGAAFTVIKMEGGVKSPNQPGGMLGVASQEPFLRI